MTADAERLAQRLVNPLGDGPRRRSAVVVIQNDDGELVTAQPGHHVVAADAGPEPGRQLDEEFVAALVAERSR